MKIASFGAAAIPGTEALDLLSEARLAGFDAVFFDLQGALDAWLSRDDVWQSKADRVLTAAAHQALTETLERRARELRKLIDEGRPAVLFPAVLPSLKHVDKKGRWAAFEVDSNLYPAIGIARSGDGPLDFRGPPELLAFAERLKPHFRPHGTLAKHVGAPAFLAEGKVAGAFLCDEHALGGATITLLYEPDDSHQTTVRVIGALHTWKSVHQVLRTLNHVVRAVGLTDELTRWRHHAG